jgi:DNA-binding response OmpR family regulator
MQILPGQNSHQPYHDEHLSLDLQDRVVTLDGGAVTLSRKEYRLLALLVQHAGEVVPSATLLTHVWGCALQTRIRTLDMHIRQLRQKLGMHRRYIETVPGVGYRFRPLPEP